MNEKEAITARVPKDIAEELELFRKDNELSKSDAARLLIRRGLFATGNIEYHRNEMNDVMARIDKNQKRLNNIESQFLAIQRENKQSVSIRDFAELEYELTKHVEFVDQLLDGGRL